MKSLQPSMAHSSRASTTRRRTDTGAAASSSAASCAAYLPDAAERLVDPSHADSLRAGLTRLWRDRALCDLVSRATGGPGPAAEIQVHACVAAALSDPLSGMIFGPMACVKNGVLLLPQLEAAALGALAECLYTGTMELKQETAYEVLAGCDFLQLTEMKRIVAEFMEAELDAENA